MYALPPAMVAEIKQLSISQLSRREELDLLRGRPSPPLPKHRSPKKQYKKRKVPGRSKSNNKHCWTDRTGGAGGFLRHGCFSKTCVAHLSKITRCRWQQPQESKAASRLGAAVVAATSKAAAASNS